MHWWWWGARFTVWPTIGQYEMTESAPQLPDSAIQRHLVRIAE
jgi:hypothetical protein